MGSQPIKFHKVHGNNIRISDDGTEATRFESFNQALCFTNRPLQPEEKLVVRILHTCKAWSGTLRVGVTWNNPDVLAHNLPKYVCPDLNMRPGNWGKALEENNVEQNKEIVIYYKRRGVVMIQVDNLPPEEFISGIPTSKPLYVLFDIYGNTKSICIRLANSSINPKVASSSTTAIAKCESFPDAALAPASFIEFKSENVSVDVTTARSTSKEGNRPAFAVAETPLVPGRTLIVNIAALHQAKPITIVITNEDARSVFACGSLEKLCDTGYSLSFESEMPKRGDDLAICLAYNGAVYISHSNRRWIPRVHVDEKVEYHIVFDMENISQLRMVGVAEDLTPVSEEAPAPVHESTGFDCIICLESSRNVLLEPCNHLALCENCARSLVKTEKRECPICRTSIQGVRKIYVT